MTEENNNEEKMNKENNNEKIGDNSENNVNGEESTNKPHEIKHPENEKNIMKDGEESEKGIISTEVSGEMKKAYLDYAMSVIVSRAIPSVEDGLKPVQRRILYSMKLMGLKPDGQTKKSARIVGDVMGKYHPHGDSAIYETMVRMAQDFSMRYPLVFGQGNFGSIDGDSAAAMRYTEAKTEKISSELLSDIDKGTVDYVPNYDGSLKEPTLLTGKVPNLLINGATGIAVGMATNIPPHNLSEVCDAIDALIKNPEMEIEDITKIIRGPDFPTGGSVHGDMDEIYREGRGRLVMRGKVSIEKFKRKEVIIIKEIPYMVNKASLVEQIAKLATDKKIKNLADIRDESSQGETRIVIELKQGTNPKFVTNALYKYTRLQDNFNVNLLSLVNGQPEVLNIKRVLEEYIKYRKKIITLRTKFELNKAKERQEVVEGLLIALKNIDSVVDMIKKASNTPEALKVLMSKFDLSEKQAKAVLETKLQQLTSLEQGKLQKEHEELVTRIDKYMKILGDINEVLKIISREIKELKDNFGDERKTNVLRNIKDIKEKDLVQKKDVVVTITDKGYVKRMDLQTYRQQKRGGRGVIGSNLSTEDFTRQLIYCSTHDYLMFFTTRGRVLWLKAYEIPAAERYSKGRSLNNLLSLRDESVTNVISVRNFNYDLFMATKKGVVKRISLKYFSKPRLSGIKAINLPTDNSDRLIDVHVVEKGQGVLLATKEGQAIRFNSSDVRGMSRASYGVRGIKLLGKDEVVSLETLNTEEVLTITKKGYGKRTKVEDYRKTARAGKGVINLKETDKTGEVVTTVAVNEGDSVIITTAKGMIMRTSLENIRVMGRATQGVRLVKLQEKDYVTDLVRVIEEEKD